MIISSNNQHELFSEEQEKDKEKVQKLAGMITEFTTIIVTPGSLGLQRRLVCTASSNGS